MIRKTLRPLVLGLVLAFGFQQAQAELVLRQATASQAVLLGPFVDTSGAIAAGLTISNTDVRISVNGGNIVAKNSGDCTYDEVGMYTCTLDATDTATVGRLQVTVNETGALPVYHEFQVVEEAVFDACCAASAAPVTPATIWAYSDRQLTALDEDVTTFDWNATTIGTVTTAGTVNALAANSLTAAAAAADLGTELGTAIWATTTRSLTILDEDSTTLDLNATVIGSLATAPTIAWNAAWDAEVQSEATDALNAYDPPTQAELTAALAALNDISLTEIQSLTIEDQGGGGNISFACALAAILAYVGGDVSTTGTSSTYEDPSGTETRISGTTTSAGNRTASITCPTL